MDSTQKIINFFIEHKDIQYSINSVAKYLKINYRIAFEKIIELGKDSIISINKLGNSNQCSYNYKFNEKTLEAENMRKNKLLKNKNINVLYNRLAEIKTPFFMGEKEVSVTIQPFDPDHPENDLINITLD